MVITRKRSIVLFVAAALALVTLTGAKGCQAPGGGIDTAQPTASPSPLYTEPRGVVAPPPANGGGVDPNDDDFNLPAKPPKDAPKGTVTYEVRAQMYNAQGESIGGLATAFINADALNPGALGGVGGSRPGVFPYNRESVRLPFQFPIFIQPGITVSVGATFNAFADKGEILACWLTNPSGLEIRGTRFDVQAAGNHSLLSVSCYGNMG